MGASPDTAEHDNDLPVDAAPADAAPAEAVREEPAPAAPETRAAAPAEVRALDEADADPIAPADDPDDDGDDDSDPADDDDKGMVLSRTGCANARAMVRSGKVDHGPFTFDAADRAAMLGPNGTHSSELQRHHLGTDRSRDDPAKAAAYPFAKDGKVFSRAFRSIARKAAANGHDDVAKAANDLMVMAQPPDDDGRDEAAPKKKGRAARPGGRKYRDLPFAVTQTSDDGSYFEGYAAVYNNVDEYNTIMARGCFDADIERFRSEGFLGGLNHDWDNPIGSPSVVRSDHKGLFVGGNVLDTAHGLDVRRYLKARICKKMSFGFDVLEQTYLDDLDACLEYWRTVAYVPTDLDRERAAHGVVLFTRVRVFEASPVMVPGNADADITAVRSGDEAESQYLTLDDHVLAVRAAVVGFCDRLEQLARMRSGEGRSLSDQKHAWLREFRDRLDSALDACRPRPTRAELAAFRREMLLLDID